MSPPPLLRLVWVLVLGAAAPAAAWGGTPTKVFPLSAKSTLPPYLEGAPERLTNVIAKMVGAKVSDSSIAGAAMAAGCTLNDSGCLDQIASANHVKEIVFGTIRVGDDQRVFVKLTRFIAGTERREKTFVLTSSESPKALARQLARSAREMFELPPLAEGDAARSEPEPEDEPVRPRKKPPRDDEVTEGASAPLDERQGAPRRRLAETERDDGRRDAPVDAPATVRRGRVTRGTYFLITGGVMTMAAGTGFAVLGSSLRDDLSKAKQTTPDDQKRITAIQRAARIRTTTGTILLVGGGAAVAGGIVRAVLQRRSIDSDRTVSVVPVEGGAAVVFSGRLP